MAVIYKIQFVGSDGAYIGSALDLTRRKQQHVSSLRRGRHHCISLQRAFAKYGEATMTVTVIIEVWCERKELIGYEQEAIDRARHNGEKLYNASLIAGRPGGVGHPHSTATRKKLSAIAKAQNRHIPQTDEVKAKIKHTKRAKLKPKQLTLGVGGRPAVTAETRAKQSASLLRYNAENARSLETRQKLSVSKMGHEVSEEARRKISEAQKRRLSDPVKRAKCGVWAGKKQSSEHKAKIAAGMRSFKAAQREAAI